MIVEAFSNSAAVFHDRIPAAPPDRSARSRTTSGTTRTGPFAKYLADVAEHFAVEWGVTFQSISPMNEPNTSYWQAYSPKQEGCHFDPGPSQSRILISLSNKLKAKGLGGILIVGTDETSIDTQALSLTQLSPEALAAVSRVDTHAYSGTGRDLRLSRPWRGKTSGCPRWTAVKPWAGMPGKWVPVSGWPGRSSRT